MENYHEFQVTYRVSDEQYNRLTNLLERWNKISLSKNEPLSTDESLFEFMMQFGSSHNINDKMDFFNRDITNQERLLTEESTAPQITPDPQICSQAMYDTMNPTQRHILKNALEAFAPGSPIHVTIHSPTALRISDSTGDVIMFSSSPLATVLDSCHYPNAWKEHQAIHPASPTAPEPLAP